MSDTTAQIKADRMAALKSRETETKELLDYIYGQVQLREKEPNAKGDHAVAVIKAYIKSAKECVGQYTDTEAIAKFQREIAILDKYLPTAASEEEVKAAIDAIKAAGETSKGGIMKALKNQFGDALDGKMASSLI